MNWKKMYAGCVALLAATLVPAPAVHAEDPPKEPPKPWSGEFTAGVAITSGNSNTTGINAALKAAFDPKTRNVLKLDGFYLYSRTEGVASVDKGAFGIRDEYSLTDRIFAFAEARYQKDRFKHVSYLITPMVGAGYKIVNTKEMVLAVDGSVGVAFERDTDLFFQALPSTTSGAFRLGQSFSWQISPAAKLTEGAWGLFKMDDISDANYHFEIALNTGISKLFELKVAFLDDYKNKPTGGSKKNDTSFIAGVGVKF
jgi:putative salt-induced outer membrane protein